jgi:Ca2+-binding RTX toxin-like protein
VQFLVDGASYGSPVSVSEGTAQLEIAEPVGTFTVAAQYTGDAGYAATLAGAETAATLTVGPATTTSLSPVSSSVASGQSATFTAVVTSSSAGRPPDGTVQFLVNGSDYSGAVTVTGGTAQLAISEPVGSYTVTAQYTGDGTNYAASAVSSASSLTVTQAITKTATATVVTPASASVKFGQSVTFTATVSSSSGTPTDGSFQFLVNGSNYDNPVPLSGGAAQLAISEGTGTFSVSARYSGDSTYAATLQSAETPATLTVVQATTTTSLSPSSASVIFPQTATFTATVSSPSGTPSDGTVQFLVNGSDYASAVPLSSGTAQLAISEPAGTYSVTAQYTGDGTNYAASPVSTASTLTVAKSSLLATTTTITPGLPSVSAGQSVTFTATVSSTSGAPSDGSVQFLVNGSDYGGAVAVTGGTAQQSITEPAGTYTIRAQYLGDVTQYAASPLSADATLSVLQAATTTPMNSTQTSSLLDGLQGLATWASGLDQYGLLGQNLPLVDQSIGSALNISNVLQVGLVNPLQPLQNQANNGSVVTSDNIVNDLKGLSSSTTGLTISVLSSQVTGGLQSTAQGQEIEFSFDFDATRTTSAGFDLGANEAQYGLNVTDPPTVTLSTSLEFAFTFGINLSNSNAFFFQVDNLSVSASAQLENPNFSAQVGFLGVQVQNASISLDAGLSVTINDPSQIATNDVSLTALQNDSLSDLVSVVATSHSLNVTLPVQATLGTWTASGSPTVTITSSNVFDGTAPAIAFNSDANVLLDFNRLTTSDFSNLFSQLGTALQDIAPSLNVPGISDLPFVGEQIDQLVNFNQMSTDLGSDLSVPEIVGASVAPADGQLSAGADFSIAINGQAPVSVTVAAASTQNNQSLDNLVSDINNALSAASLTSDIAASRNGSQIVLSAVSASVTQFQVQIADPTNPAVTELGFAQGQNSALSFKFSTIQSLATLLSSVTGVTANPQYDPTTNLLSFTLDFQDGNFTQTLPLNFSTGLSLLAFDGAATASVQATADLKSTFEINLEGLQTVLTGTGPAPSNGQLTADAHFTLTVGSQSPVNVTLTAALTQSNLDVADLVSDLNNALAAAGVGGAVVAGQSGGIITLTDTNGDTLQLSASSSDPATTELHLPTQSAGRNFGANVYLAGGGQLTVSASVSASGINGSASLGILGVGIQGGSLSLSAGTGLTLNGTGSDSLQSLMNTATNASLLTAQSVTASLQGQFPLTVTGVPGINVSSASLGLSLGTPNDLTTVTVTPNSQLNAALSEFANLDIGDVQQALQAISGFLSGSDLGVFTTKLPLLNESLDDLLDTSGIFNTAASALGQSDVLSSLQTEVQTLSSSLRSAIEGLPGNVSTTQLISIAQDLNNAGDLSTTAASLASSIVATAEALNDEIQSLEQSGIDATTLSALTGVLTQIQNATPSIQGLSSAISSALGITAPNSLTIQLVTATSSTGTQDQDLEVMLDLQPSFTKSINIGSLGLGGSLGPLTVSSGGTINVTVGGNAEIDFGYDLTNPGVFLLGSTQFGLTASINATNLSFSASIGVSVGPATITLTNGAGTGPAAVAITTVPPGPGNQIPVTELSTSDFQFSGIDGQFSAQLPLTVFGSSVGTLSVSLNLQNPGDMSVVPPSGLEGILTGADFDPSVLASGIEAFLSALETGLENSLGELPLIGKLNLDTSTGVFGALNSFVASLATTDLSSGAVDAITNLIKSSLGSLLAPSSTSNPNVSLTPDGDEIDAYFELKGTDSYTTPLNTQLGGLGLNFTTQGGVSLSLGYDIRLGFALNKTTGFSFLLNPDSNGDEFTFTASAGLTPNAQLQAQLFCLDLTATNETTTGPGTGLNASLGISLPNLNGDNTLSLSQLGSSLFTADYMPNATANIDLLLDADINKNPSLPSFSTDLTIKYPLLSGMSVDDTSAQSNLTVALDNMTLKFGSLFSTILGPIMQDVDGILGPIQPILDFLNGDVPVVSNLSEEVGLGPVKWDQLLELAASLAGVDFDFSAFNQAVSILDTIVDLASDVESFGNDSTGINFGNYTFNSSTDLRTSSSSSLNTANLLSLGSQSESDGSPVTQSQIQNQINSDPETNTDPSTGQSMTSGGLLTNLKNETGLDFPILDNPLEIVQFLLGQNVNLVTWTMPTLSIDVPINIPFAEIPVGPFDVTVLFTGNVGLTFNATVGLDTSGLKQGDLLDGLWFGTTKPLLTANFSVGAGVEAGIYIVSVGFDMQLGSNLNFGFADLNHDGEVYLDQIESACAFQESGDVYVKADFLVTFGISIFSYTVDIPIVPAVTLFSFSSTCAPLELAHFSTGTGEDAGIPAGTLILNTGKYSGDRQSGASGGDNFVTVTQVKPGVMQVAGFGTTQDYGTGQVDGNGNPEPAVTGIYADGTGDKSNEFHIDSSVTVPTTLIAGAGNDQIFGGSGKNLIIGGSGNDYLQGGSAADTIEGGTDNDNIYTGTGNVLVLAGNGNDNIFGQGGADTIEAGSGNDSIYGGTGNDSISVGGGNDQIYGQGGNNTIIVTGAGSDLIEGGAGSNYISSGSGKSVIFGDVPSPAAGSGNDTIYGGGADTIYGGTGENTIHGGSGDDLIYGGPLNDVLYADTGTDQIYGEAGNDTIYGGVGDSSLYGGDGDDVLYGGTGNQYLDGGDGNDFLYGGTGDQTMVGGTGDDYFQTGQGDEQIYGGTDGNKLLVQYADADQALTNNTLTGLGTDTYSQIQRISLTMTGAANDPHTFDVSGYTGVATLTSESGNDIVASTDDANFTLADGRLTRSDGASFGLVNITRANLTGTEYVTFDITGWDGLATLAGGSGVDLVDSFSDGNQTLTDTSLVRADGGTFTLSGINSVNLTAGPGNVVLNATGYSGQVSLYGGAGNDTLEGGSGDDYIVGGAGHDYLSAGSGNTILVGTAGTGDTLIGGPGQDTIYGSQGADSISGGTGSDVIYSGPVASFISGGTGPDTIVGGASGDTIYGNGGPGCPHCRRRPRPDLRGQPRRDRRHRGRQLSLRHLCRRGRRGHRYPDWRQGERLPLRLWRYDHRGRLRVDHR